MSERKMGFYWCDMGKVRGLLSGWCVCWWDVVDKVWHIPYYNERVKDDFFDNIDETPITRQH